MGTWGTAAWENDAAADWFGDLFEATGLARYVEETLQLDPEDESDEIRAAAYLLVALGRVYIWPVDDLERHLNLAVTKLEAIRSLYEDEAPDIVAAIEGEIATLKLQMK